MDCVGRDENGKFTSLGGDFNPDISLNDLPKTNLQVIKLYQKYGILPTKYHGIPLKIRKITTKS